MDQTNTTVAVRRWSKLRCDVRNQDQYGHLNICILTILLLDTLNKTIGEKVYSANLDISLPKQFQIRYVTFEMK